ncbi:MarR family winged helix-turn-helix transcriptional regulator [Cytobacillus praedii]|uniref:MarR family winged helix-turn-helix transcriptional regulator n=1 Tax=Cytobacillus praedii TaxID=1742358 RepID=UPI002E1CD879|nr:MarR family transcriptional regulator [Cytobacillus praedii]MED3551747.1 MarR family transcriptional regulator [Cytobacillus praedii]
MEEQTIFEIIHNMDKVTNKLIIQWSKMFNEDLGITHILVLGHLLKSGKSRPSDIARNLGLTPATLTHLSEKLVRKELAIRIADESDRRIMYLGITDKGIDIVHKANEYGQLLRRNLFEKLTGEEKEQLLKIFGKLNEPS